MNREQAAQRTRDAIAGRAPSARATLSAGALRILAGLRVAAHAEIRAAADAGESSLALPRPQAGDAAAALAALAGELRALDYTVTESVDAQGAPTFEINWQG